MTALFRIDFLLLTIAGVVAYWWGSHNTIDGHLETARSRARRIGIPVAVVSILVFVFSLFR